MGDMEIVLATLFLGFLLSVLFVIPRLQKSGHTKSAMSDANININSKASRRYNKAEISLHNKRTDCWIIIKDKVYDVTPYVEEHPGGDAILVHAGDDSTEGFLGHSTVPESLT